MQELIDKRNDITAGTEESEETQEAEEKTDEIILYSVFTLYNTLLLNISLSIIGFFGISLPLLLPCALLLKSI